MATDARTLVQARGHVHCRRLACARAISRQIDWFFATGALSHNHRAVSVPAGKGVFGGHCSNSTMEPMKVF